MKPRRLWASVSALIVAAVAILGGTYLADYGAAPVEASASAEPAGIPPADPGSVAQLAASLSLIDETATIPEYRRESFGTRWADIDGNGCDQRQDLLARDLTDITRDRCTVLTGVLQDPYTGASITFQHDRVALPGSRGSQGVQGDHIVSLSAAHAGGAWRWTPDDREAFANTLSNLLAVDGTTNQSKSDRGPSSWMPPNAAFECDYAQRYAEILAQWRLSVLQADRDALIATLTACGR